MLGATAVGPLLACGDESATARDHDEGDRAPATSRTQRSPTPTPEATHARSTFGYAVLPAGTPIRTFADPAAPASFLPAPPAHHSEGPLPAAPRGTVVMVSGRHGDLLEVETLGPPATERHCEHPLQGAEHFRLRLYVPVDAPLTVATRTIEHLGEADTAVTVHPGTPLVRISADTWAVDAEGVRVALPIPDDARGRLYVPSPPKGIPVPPSARVPEATVLRFDGTPLQGIERLPGAPRPLVHRVEAPSEGTESLVRVQTRCMDLQLRSDHAAKASLEPTPTSTDPPPTPVALASAAPGAMAGAFGTLLAEDHEVSPGVTIYWQDGRVAGQVVASHRFEGEAERIAGRPCFSTRLLEPDGLRLCFDPADVRIHASAVAAAPPAAPSPAPITAYGLGLVGRSGSAGRIPRVRMTKGKVDGALDRDIVRRIVRAHINEVRYCYNEGLARDPSLSGRVAIRFVVSPTGSVAASVVEASTVSDATVSKCIAKAVRRWKFPKPRDGNAVLVEYPFVLSPG